LLKKIIVLIKNPKKRLEFFISKGLYKKMSDEKFLKRAYKVYMMQKLDLKNPRTYTEKLQWLKIYDHRDKYTTMVDKYSVKEYVQSIIGDEYVIPTIGVYDSADDIDFDCLPNKFVLKCTHDSGSIIVCEDKSQLDIKKIRIKLNRLLEKNYYSVWREWPYKNVKPRIIAEKYMMDEKDKELRDYKFFTFGGIPRVLYITQGRSAEKETVADFFDMNFEHLDFKIDHENALIPPHPPKNFELMKTLAEKLSQGTPQLRVDFYEVDGKVYFGEMTFFHCSGFTDFEPKEWNKIFGDWVTLPKQSK